MKRGPVPATPRRPMTPARRQRILAHHHFCCAYPACEECEGLQIDHVICLELGGRDDDSNMEPLCAAHHKQKTARDLRMIAKARRIRKRLEGLRKPRRPIPARKLQSAPFRSHPTLKRGMDGVVRVRT